MGFNWKNNNALRRKIKQYTDNDNATKRECRRAEMEKRMKSSNILKEKFEQFMFDKDIVFMKEYRFCDRKFRFDYVIPHIRTAIEIEGGLYIAGRHVNPKGMKTDMEKYNLAAYYGWTVIRFPADELNKHHNWLLEYIEKKENEMNEVKNG